MNETKCLFISFPRSGSHFVNNVLRTYGIDSKHGHDIDLIAKPKGIFYLYRNPVDVIFSYHSAEFGQIGENSSNFREDFVLDFSQRLSNHRKFYFQHSDLKISFESLLKNENLWNQILDYYNVGIDKKVLQWAIEENCKEKLAQKINRQYMNKNMLTNEYNENRLKFKQIFGETIEGILK